MADQRSSFRFRLPWLPAASAPRPTAQRPPAQPTPAARRTPETLVPSQPTSTTSAPSPGQQSTASATTPTAAAPQRTVEKQVPSQPKSTATPVSSQSTNATTVTPQIQSPTKGMPPSSATSKKDETEAPSASIPDIPGKGKTQTDQTQPPSPSTALGVPTTADTQTPQTQPPSQSTAPGVPTTADTQTPQTQPPSQSTAPGVPTTADTQTPQTQASSQSTAPGVPTTADTQTPQTQPSSQPTTTDTSDMPPIKPTGATSPQASLPQPERSRTESQPSSPARPPQSRPASQPASPSRATNQSRTSQPSTPPHAASQPRATSVLSSPSRKGSPKSPTPGTTSQPTSQPRTPPRPVPGQTPTTSPSRKVAKGQQTTAAHAESTSPSKGEARPSSTAVQEKESKTIISTQPTEQLQPKEETKARIISESQTQTPVKTRTESNGKTQQTFKESGKVTTTTSATPTGIPQTPTHTQKSDTPTRNGKPESFPQDSKSEETKEVKEIMQETEKKVKKEAIEKDDYHLTRDLASAVQTKEQLSFISQSEKGQQALEQTEVIHRPVSNGKESKTTAQTKNKSVSVESRQRLPMTNGEHIPLHKEVRGDISKLVKKMAAGDPAQTTNEKPVCVITLAGENRGATMQLGTDSMKRGSPVPIHRGYKINPDESVETSTDGERSFKVRSEDTKEADQTPEAFINSNIQGINNSIMFNGSITERNPGVRLVHSRFPMKYKKSMEETEFFGKEKTEFTAAHAQRPIYKPMVKRRCLRGLLLESSDSDTENTTKPRHHGCRVGCKEKS